ncbi:protein MpPPR_29 [Marchantia polymorpha subsp. ruderalis]
MDFVRVQGLTLRPPSETVRGCSRRHRQQMQLKLGSVYQSGGNSGVFQKLKPGLALRPGGRRCRGKGTGGVRASIPPDAAVAAFTTAVAGCWLYMNKLKLSSTSPENSESAATASASLKPRTSVSGPDISSIHSQRTEATSAEASVLPDHVLEIQEQHEHRYMSGFLASTSESTSDDHVHITDHLEVVQESEETDAPVVESSPQQSLITSVVEADSGVVSSPAVEINGTFSSLKGEMVDSPAAVLELQLDCDVNIVESLEERLSVVDSSDLASRLIESGDESVASEEASAPEDAVTVIEEADALASIVSEVNSASTLQPETTVLTEQIPEASPGISSVKDVEPRAAQGNGNSRRLHIVPKVSSPVTSDKSKGSSLNQKVANKTTGRKLPTRLSDILPIEETADAELHLKIYRALISSGRIQDSVLLLEAMDKVNILDTSKIHQSRFFKTCQSQKAVKEAFRFTRLISRPTLNTYNMLISVCREARDVDAGLRALSAAEKSGFKPDAILYTTLISTCAKAAKVDIAFKVYHDMEAAGVVPNIQTYGSLIDGCARAGQIAKAFGVYGIMLSKQVKPDIAIFNTLINACGRAGALERAFDVLADMKGEPCFLKPNHVTYGALIMACAKAGQVERAFEVYRSMRKSGTKGTLECYTAAVHACSQTGDLDLAHTVLEDMKVDGMQPDEIFFSALVDVAGQATDLEGAFKILDEMKEFGLTPKSITYSAVMGVCSNTGNWERALNLYHEIKESGLVPTVSTFNALITALSNAKQINPAFSVLEEMKGVGVMPDQITYSILLAACETLDEPDIGFQLYAKARGEGLVPNQSICDSVIGMCYARIRQRLPAPGYLETRGVLAGSSMEEPHKQWTSWALSAYRQTVAAGYTPTIKSVSLLMGCLRKHETPERRTALEDSLFAHHEIPENQPLSILDSGSLYDPKALAIFEEAATMGIVPRFNYTAGPITLSAETLPSYVAEVSLITLLKGLKKRHYAGAQLYPVTINHFVEIKRTLTATREVKELHISGRSGQAMAALLRRLKLHYQGHESSGKLRITVASIKKWLKPISQSEVAAETQQSQRPSSMSPRNVFVAKSIAEQQRAIRTGGGPNFPNRAGRESQVLDIYRKQVSQVGAWDLKEGDLETEQENFSLNSTTSTGKVYGARRLQSVVASAVKDVPSKPRP